MQAPPPVKFKDLEEVVSSRILRNQISFDYRFDFMRITGDTILVPVTVQIQNKQMTFRDHDGVQSASLNLFGRISSMTGRVIQTFEDVIQRDFPDSLLEPSLKGFSIYQKAVPLRPGLYKLDLVIKDVNSGNVGVVNTRLAVSPIPDDKLEASSLILADQMEPVSSKDVGVGQFVLGSTKVRPKLDAEFHADQPLDVYLQFYNLKVDDKTHKNNVSLDFKVTQGDQTVSHEVKTGDELKQNGEQVTFEQVIRTQDPAARQIQTGNSSHRSGGQPDGFAYGGFHRYSPGCDSESGSKRSHREVTSPYEVDLSNSGLGHGCCAGRWPLRQRRSRATARSRASFWTPPERRRWVPASG